MSSILSGFSVPAAPQQNATVQAAQLVAAPSQLLRQLIQQRNAAFSLFWGNAVAIAAAQGTKAASLAAEDAALVAYISSRLLANGWTAGTTPGTFTAPAPSTAVVTLPGIPAGRSLTPNADGTVTVV